MLDFNAYLAAQHLTRDLVSEALPDTPVRPAHVTIARRPTGIAARQWLSLTLRRLAEVIEPARPSVGSAMPAGR